MSEFHDFIAAGIDFGFVGFLNTNLRLIGGTKTAPAAGNAAGNPMLELRGIASANLSIGNPDVVDIPGKNGNQGSFMFGPLAAPQFDVENGVFQQSLEAMVQNLRIFLRGAVSMSALQPQTFTLADLVIVLAQRVKVKTGGLMGASGFHGYTLPVANMYPIGQNGIVTRQGASDRYRVVGNPADVLCDGVDIDLTNFQTEGAPVVHWTANYPFYYHRWTGNNTIDTYHALRLPVPDLEQVFVTVNDVELDEGDDFDIDGYDLVFDTPPASNAVIVAQVGFDPNAALAA